MIKRIIYMYTTVKEQLKTTLDRLCSASSPTCYCCLKYTDFVSSAQLSTWNWVKANCSEKDTFNLLTYYELYMPVPLSTIWQPVHVCKQHISNNGSDTDQMNNQLKMTYVFLVFKPPVGQTNTSRAHSNCGINLQIGSHYFQNSCSEGAL